MRRHAAVLGSPIEHSRSPLLHNAAYATLGLDWDYTAIDVPAGGLAEFKTSLDESWLGFSLTMPLKVEVLPLLDGISDAARRIGAVNTVTVQDGGWFGDNTDVPAMIRLLAGHDGTALVLGTGATARSAVVALSHLDIDAAHIWGRRPEAAQDIARYATSFGLNAKTLIEPAPLHADIVVNTLPDTASAKWADVLSAQPHGLLLDAIYDPWPPPLTAIWPSERVRSGFDLLLEQAALQIELWSGRDAPRRAMGDALLSTIPEGTLDRALH